MFWNGNTASEGFSGSGKALFDRLCRRGGLETNGEHVHRPGDVLDLLLAQIVEDKVELVTDLVAHHPADADAARFGQTFETGGDVDPVAENIAVLDDDVALVNADPEHDAPVRRHAGVAFRHRALHVHRAAHRVDDTGEFDQQPIAHCFDDAALMLLNLKIAELPPDCPQRRERTFLVLAHQPRVAGDIDRNDCRKTSLDPLAAHVRKSGPAGNLQYTVRRRTD